MVSSLFKVAVTGERIREAALEERGMVKEGESRGNEKLVQVSINCYVAKLINPYNVSVPELPLKMATVLEVSRSITSTAPPFMLQGVIL